MTGQMVNYSGESVPTFGHREDATNALRYIISAYRDEPLFVIRGRDHLAVPTIRNYAELVCGIPDMDLQVMEHLQRFVGFRVGNPELMKYPDPFPGWPRIGA